MSPTGEPPPVDPHDLRLGARKMFGWEIFPSLLNCSFGLSMVLVWRVYTPKADPSFRDVFILMTTASLVLWFANWTREKQARRGSRATWWNGWDMTEFSLLVVGIIRSGFATDRLTPWFGILLVSLIVVGLVKARNRRRRSLAPTPSQLAESAFE